MILNISTHSFLFVFSFFLIVYVDLDWDRDVVVLNDIGFCAYVKFRMERDWVFACAF